MDKDFEDLNQMLPEQERQEIERLWALAVEKTPSLRVPAAPWLCRFGIHIYTRWWIDRVITVYPYGTTEVTESTLYKSKEAVQHRVCKRCLLFEARETKY